jgi:uncharacterized protein (DUF2252 family)
LKTPKNRLAADASLAERKAAGKALRRRVGFRALGTWRPPARRADPVAVLKASDKGREPSLLPIRYGRMLQSPFAFYRGAAAIMARDLSAARTSGILVQACGDCHLLNFGGFATPERRVAFDINDFDETLPAAWEWDVKRLAASFVVASRQNGLRKADARAAAERCARSYREHMCRYAELSPLDVWHEHIDAEALIVSIHSRKWKKRLREQLAKAPLESSVEHHAPKVAVFRGGVARIEDKPPLVFHRKDLDASRHERMVRQAFERYRGTLPDDRRVLLDRYALRDLAAKVVGIGSVGTLSAVLLMVAEKRDALFLQVKEARRSVLEPFAGKSGYANHGERVVVGQRLMQAASDMFLGWTTLRGRHFYIRQLNDMKIKPAVELLDAEGMGTYAEGCAWALARAHAKSGDAALISGYLGNTPAFDRAIARFALAYADQNEHDYDALSKAARRGRVEADTGVSA